LSAQVERADRATERWADEHPMIDLLQTAPGMGRLIATSCVLCVKGSTRFAEACDVAGALGCPPMPESGATLRLGGIIRQGDGEMRRLLVQGVHVLPRCKRDSDLERWGLALEQRLGTRRAVVAVARKLAVWPLPTWHEGAAFEPVLADRLGGAAASAAEPTRSARAPRRVGGPEAERARKLPRSGSDGS
jgi:transposase